MFMLVSGASNLFRARAAEGNCPCLNEAADYPGAPPHRSCNPYWSYYVKKEVPKHDPVEADDLGLTWQLPLRAEDSGFRRVRDIGGAYHPALKGRERGPWRNRYRGIHRGHDLGVPASKLRGRKFPVRAIADGIYDGHRTYTHSDPFCIDCSSLIVYHFAKNGSDKVYTSIYAHVEPIPGLKPGKRVKGGEIIGNLADPMGMWIAHVHLELYTRPVFSAKDTTRKRDCECKTNALCDEMTLKNSYIPRGCGIFEDDLYLLEPVLFINKHIGKGRKNKTKQ